MEIPLSGTHNYELKKAILIHQQRKNRYIHITPAADHIAFNLGKYRYFYVAYWIEPTKLHQIQRSETSTSLKQPSIRNKDKTINTWWYKVFFIIKKKPTSIAYPIGMYLHIKLKS